MADNCNDRIPPEIIPPTPGMPTKEQLLSILGYEEFDVVKTDSDGLTVTATIAGKTVITGG